MKKPFTLLSATIIIALFFASCTKDPVVNRDTYLGTWNILETGNIPGGGSVSDEEYSINISKAASTSYGVVITNFANIGLTIQGTVGGSSLTIPVQTINIGSDKVSLSATGSISGSTLTLNYTFNDWSGTCTGTKL